MSFTIEMNFIKSQGFYLNTLWHSLLWRSGHLWQFAFPKYFKCSPCFRDFALAVHSAHPFHSSLCSDFMLWESPSRACYQYYHRQPWFFILCPHTWFYISPWCSSPPIIYSFLCLFFVPQQLEYKHPKNGAFLCPLL